MIDISIENLHYTYPPPAPEGEPVVALRGIDLQVPQGEFLALMGRVGAGKTTLCLALNGLVPHATGGVIRGNVLVLGRNTKTETVPDLAADVGLVFQNPEEQLFHLRVEDEVAFGPENLGLPREEIARRVVWALEAVGLDGFQGRSPLQLSGGEKQRLAIAAVLAMRPRILVLDEPTASLDPRGAAEVFDTLRELRQVTTMPLTIVMATQNSEAVAEQADRVVVLDQGAVALDGSPDDVLSQVERMHGLGVGVPQVAEAAALINARLGTSFRFTRLEDAERALAAALRRRQAAVQSERAGDDR
ncbi:MAG TPA: ATP-binding cassette domain-containing protein [Anaerolineae bacterium]|nr:ATP-binding cassette domain-containing protein [Anaerolineae bacterium]